MLKIENLNKYFYRYRSNQIHAVDNTSIEFPDTGIVALLGPSGCGKTTLLNCIGGLDKWNSGKIIIDNKKITKRKYKKLDKLRNLNIGYIFQDYKIVDDMTVFENVALSLRMCGIKDKKVIEERVFYVLKSIDLFRYRNRLASMLSGGERQRVGIARAIVKNPDIVICDEPTGNLDSRNSVEIMNIIKVISKSRLVILVTHEVELANFYADRIIKISDGKVISDEINKPSENLNYELDNKIYLKDFKNQYDLKKDKLDLKFYSDDDIKNIKIVYKNGNLYIDSSEVNNVEIINSNNNYELINSHHKKIDKTIYEKYNFELSDIKKKNKGIYSLFKSFKYGFRKVVNYNQARKFLALGYFVTSLFIIVCACEMLGVNRIVKTDYASSHDSYVYFHINKDKVNLYNYISSLENVNYVIPAYDNLISEKYAKLDYYDQTRKLSTYLSADYAYTSLINESDLIVGSMPSNNREVVVDEFVFEKSSNYGDQNLNTIGIKDYKDMVGKIILINKKEYTISGLVSFETPVIYFDESIMSEFYNVSNDEIIILDDTNYLDNIKVVRGRLPGDYEVLLPNSLWGAYYLNQTIKNKVNGTKLKISGFYESPIFDNQYFVNNFTFKTKMIDDTNAFVLSTSNKNETIELLKDIKQVSGAEDVMLKSYYELVANKSETTQVAMSITMVLIVISFVELFLMSRSSFLSRIREVGIYRAIGIKKSDILKMFAGELLAVSTIYSLTGVICGAALVNALTDIKMFKGVFYIDYKIITIVILVVYLFNLLVGLLPVINTVRKTPAQILSRKDI